MTNRKLMWLLVGVLTGTIVTSGLLQANAKETPEMSDSWIDAKITTTYLFNEYLSPFEIDIDVENQVVRLSGTVESEIEKDLAYEVARSVEGVKHVENAIVVTTGTRSARAKSAEPDSFQQTVSDLTTTAAIKTNYLANENVSGMKINVDTKNSQVTLRGKVKSSIERELAEQIAKNTAGVTAVKNELIVEGKPAS